MKAKNNDITDSAKGLVNGLLLGIIGWAVILFCMFMLCNCNYHSATQDMTEDDRFIIQKTYKSWDFRFLVIKDSKTNKVYLLSSEGGIIKVEE